MITAPTNKPSFKLVSRERGTSLPTYEVRIGGTLAGTVTKREHPFFGVDWVARYNDGTVTGLASDTRIDAAWALVNS